MKWWKQLDSWICIGIFIVTIVFIWWRWKTLYEGFQTAVNTNIVSGTRTDPNLRYPFSEVYLVAPNDAIDWVDIYDKDYPGPSYSLNGYTYKQAQSVCQGLGGDLATFAQVQRALALGGNWCVKGWIKDGKTTNSIPSHPVYLAQESYNSCGVATGIYSTLGTLSTPRGTDVVDTNLNNAVAFPICYAPKPPNPAVAIQPFSALNYSWIDSDTMQAIKTGYYNLVDPTLGKDIFPVVFTDDQVNYALMNAPNSFNTTTNTWSTILVRNYLIRNTSTVNAGIMSTTQVGYSDDPSLNSCTSLSTIDGDYAIKVSTLQQLFKDVSGSILNSIRSKFENSEIQANLFNICKGLTPEASPACAKLATIDYDTFYTNPRHSVLSDLETLTYNRNVLESELCTGIIAVQQVKQVVGCTYTSKASRYCKDICNPSDPAGNCYISTQTAYGDGNKQYIDFDQTNVEGLKVALMNISPLFTTSAYKDIVASAITSLTTVLIDPALVDFSNAKQKIGFINQAIKNMKTILESEYAGT